MAFTVSAEKPLTSGTALVKPELLAWARRTAGFTVSEAARRLRISTNKVQDWEAGESSPSFAKLRSLAQLFKRPVAVFFLDHAPPDDPLLPDFRRRSGAAPATFSPELCFAIRAARTRRAEAIELFSDLGETPAAFALAARADEDPEKVAGRLRRALTVAAEPPVGDARAFFNHWRNAAESCGVLVFQAEHVPPEEMSAFSLSERPLPAVVLNIKEAPAARSFSLCHELAHIMLGEASLCELHAAEGAGRHAKIEVFCNHVAGAVLMPAEEMLSRPETPTSLATSLSDEAAAALAKRFGVSREAAVRRLTVLERVSVEYYRRKRQQLLQEHEARAPRGKPGFAPPSTMAIARSGPLFTRLVLEAFDEERITASDVSRFLGMKLKHLDTVRQRVQASTESADAT
jgi:Zn-dependent peptidase ImmA (M78 family)/DNA-binding transcriptional regulator YiaG